MTTDPDRLHRTAKYFMDSGRAATAEDAVDMLSHFGMTITVDAAIVTTPNGQIALLTLVNAARRTMLGGVEVEGAGNQRVVTALSTETTLGAAVAALGGTCVGRARADWPRAIIGDAPPPAGSAPAWRLQWAGWRGGVVPASWPDAFATVVGTDSADDQTFWEFGQLSLLDDSSPRAVVIRQRRLIVRVTHETLL